VVRVATAVQLFRGPLPPPEHLRGYNEVVPGSAEKILNMAVSEQGHRHKMQNLEMLYPYLGWAAGFVGFLACVGGAIYLAMNNEEHVALALLGVPVLGVIGWFIKARVGAAQPAPPSPARKGKAATAVRPRRG
jgi:hypothetical protein